MHVFRIAEGLQNLWTGADLVGTEMSQRQIGQVVPHGAIFEYVYSMLGPQECLSPEAPGLIPGESPRTPFNVSGSRSPRRSSAW